MTKLDWDKAKKKPQSQNAKMIATWWWTILRRDNVCARCSEPIPAETTFAYNHLQQRALCGVCVNYEGVAPAKSKRYMRWEKRG